MKKYREGTIVPFFKKQIKVYFLYKLLKFVKKDKKQAGESRQIQERW